MKEQIIELNPIRSKIYLLLIKRDLTRKELVNMLNIPRTTIFDNLNFLIKNKLVQFYDISNNSRGRPFRVFRLRISNKTIILSEKVFFMFNFNFTNLLKVFHYNFKVNINFSFFNRFFSFKFNFWIYYPFKKINPLKLNFDMLKFKFFDIKFNFNWLKNINVNFYKIENKCKICNKDSNKANGLIRLKDNNYYCENCICNYPNIFNLLKFNGYWFNLLKPNIRFNRKRLKVC
jgi:hypothetical protein